MSRKGQLDTSAYVFLGIIALVTIFLLVYLYAPSINLGFLSPITAFFKGFSTLVIGIVVLAIGIGLIMFGVIIAGSSVRTGRIIAYIGAAIFLLGIFALEIGQIVEANNNYNKSPVGQGTCSYTIGMPSGMFSTVSYIGDKISCLIAGYPVYGLTNLEVIGFWLFGIIVPIVLLYYVFREFVEASMIIQNPTAQGFIALAFTLIAFRGFLAARMMEILTIGLTGIAILAIDMILAGGLFGFIGRAFKSWQGVDDALGIERAGYKIKQELKSLVDIGIKSAKEKSSNGVEAALNSMGSLVKNNPMWDVDYQKALADKSDFDKVKVHLESLKRKL